jgi:hypothetical protein
MQCIACIHIDMDQRPRMTALGASSCKFDSAGIYKSLEWERKCQKYTQAAREIIEARQAHQNASGSDKE